ncbi:MAG: DNA topoisomerase (ATP-hydrolyzing) [Planctomycetota bacterium]
MAQSVEPIELSQTARERYLRYAMSVITARALPDVRDGLKPVQRRILYVMETVLHLRADGQPKKSAQVVGRVMGEYHPHGDSAIYEALVRMAQPWALRYPLIEGQGNFGAITGDSAAAFRYTEAKLRSLATSLMETLKEDTVPFRPTYDAKTTEPEVLPTPAPLLLLNGSTGIAVGMATNIPPHNLEEVIKATISLIDKPDTSVAQLTRTVKGPDFPTGGEILSTKAELREIYETGRGSIKVRGTYTVETVQPKGKRVPRVSLVIDSIPYGSTTAQVLSKIKDLVDTRKLPGIEHVSDQTDAKGVRLVLQLESGADPELLMGAIYKYSNLETSYGMNLTCLLPTPTGVGRPAVCNLKELLQAWLDFRFEVVTRSIEFRKARLEERIHILEGLQKVLGNVDAAIKLIRAAKDKADAREKLCAKYKLDDLQANAVLEIQLYRLAQLEVKKIKDELTEKSKERDRLARLLKGQKPRWDLIKDELQAFAKAHGDRKRLTKIVAPDEDEGTFDATLLIKKEDTHVLLSREGRLRRQRALDSVDKVRLREGDALLCVIQGATTENAAVFTNFGSAYVFPLHQAPATTGYGDPIQKFFSFKDGEKVVSATSLDPRLVTVEASALLVATAKGQILRVPLSLHNEPSTRAGRKLARLAKGDEVVSVDVVGVDDEGEVLVATSKGNATKLALADVPLLSAAGKGRRAARLGKQETLVAATGADKLVLETTRGSEDSVLSRHLSRGEIGGKLQEVKQRGGWTRALPKLDLFELVEEGEE